MAEYKQNERKGDATRSKPRKRKKPNPIKYKELITTHPEMTKKEAALRAGYSKNTTPSKIETNNRPTMVAIEKQRELALEKTGYTIEYVLTNLVDIIDSADYDSDKINAIKVGNAIAGYNAPEKKQIEIKGLFVELQATTTEELNELAKALIGVDGD